jgi:NifU-like protein involved in Fe-S cluster formation
MVGPALRQLLLEAPGAGSLAGPGVLTGAAEHPVCGDVVEVDLRLAGGCIDALAWRAQGCPASLAVAAAAATSLPGVASTAVASALRQRLQQLGDLGEHERHAERLVLDAVRAALQRQTR